MTRKELMDALTAAGEPVYGVREAAAVARLVAERRYGLSRADVALDPRAEVAPGEGFARLMAEIAAARPVQYILGVADFCGMELAVGEGVLIPRPETEELVQWIADDLKAAASAGTEGAGGADARGAGEIRILDIGTGSGAIAIALARRVAGARVMAIDLSDEALHYARLNDERTGAGVTIIKADALDDALDLGEWDVIVSNPPYIPASERAAMDRNVAEYEPSGALFVPDRDPLVFYRAIAKFARRSLRVPQRKSGRKRPCGTHLYFEIHEGAADTMPPMLAAEGFAEVEVRRDLNSRPRMVKATIKN